MQDIMHSLEGTDKRCQDIIVALNNLFIVFVKSTVKANHESMMECSVQLRTDFMMFRSELARVTQELKADDTLVRTNNLDGILQAHLLRIDAGFTLLWFLLNGFISNGPHAILSAVFNKSYRPAETADLDDEEVTKLEEPGKYVSKNSCGEGDKISQSCNINITLDMHLAAINSAAEVCAYVKSSKDEEMNRLLLIYSGIGTAGAFLVNIAVTGLQLYYSVEDLGKRAQIIVGVFLYSSIAFSLGSVLYSVFAYACQVFIAYMPELGDIPLCSWTLHFSSFTPMLSLIGSVGAFLVAICSFAYSSVPFRVVGGFSIGFTVMHAILLYLMVTLLMTAGLFVVFKVKHRKVSIVFKLFLLSLLAAPCLFPLAAVLSLSRQKLEPFLKKLYSAYFKRYIEDTDDDDLQKNPSKTSPKSMNCALPEFRSTS